MHSNMEDACRDNSAVATWVVFAVMLALLLRLGYLVALRPSLWKYSNPLAPFILPLFILVLNHEWRRYIQADIVYEGQSINASHYAPAIAAGLLAALSFYKFSGIALFGTAISVSIAAQFGHPTGQYVAVAFGLAFAALSCWRRFAYAIQMLYLFGAFSISGWLLFLSIIAPDARQCGHARNTIIICDMACTVITEELSDISIGYTVLAALPVAAAAAYGWKWSRQSEASRKNKEQAKVDANVKAIIAQEMRSSTRPVMGEDKKWGV